MTTKLLEKLNDQINQNLELNLKAMNYFRTSIFNLLIEVSAANRGFDRSNEGRNIERQWPIPGDQGSLLSCCLPARN